MYYVIKSKVTSKLSVVDGGMCVTLIALRLAELVAGPYLDLASAKNAKDLYQAQGR